MSAMNVPPRYVQALSLLINEDIYVIPERQQPQVPAPEQPQNAGFNYLGGNNRFFLVLADEPGYEYQSPRSLEALMKIMKARSLDIDDLAILNISRYPGITLKALRDFFAPARMLLLGINPAQLGITGIESNSPSKFDDIGILSTYSMDEMISDEAKKRIFWSAMKAF